jgi:nucleoside-diphosphate-sugar epimerase
MKKAIVLGGGGFIGHHLVKDLKRQGFWVRAVDLHKPLYEETHADDFVVGDLRSLEVCETVLHDDFDEVYQLAADMGGAGFIFTQENDAEIMHNSAIINLNVADVCKQYGLKDILYTSSACIYPEHNQIDKNNPNCSEASAYPANPDSEYGWEKLFSERIFLAYNKNHGFRARIARLHNIYGPLGTWTGGREKAPAALCRKVAEVENGGTIEVWNDGTQTRSFLYIDACLEAFRKMMDKDFYQPVNVGSEEMVSINELVNTIARVAGKEINIKHIPGPLGVLGRNSDNTLMRATYDWEAEYTLHAGISNLYPWVSTQVNATKES